MVQTASKLPSVICERDLDMTEVQLYCNDLPSSELFIQEHTRWKIKYLAKAESEQPSSCASDCKICTQTSGTAQ